MRACRQRVQVRDGEVTLSGTVGTRNQKRVAEDCVEAVTATGAAPVVQDAGACAPRHALAVSHRRCLHHRSLRDAFRLRDGPNPIALPTRRSTSRPQCRSSIRPRPTRIQSRHVWCSRAQSSGARWLMARMVVLEHSGHAPSIHRFGGRAPTIGLQPGLNPVHREPERANEGWPIICSSHRRQERRRAVQPGGNRDLERQARDRSET